MATGVVGKVRKLLLHRKGQRNMPEFTWTNFYNITKHHPHWELLERAASLFGQPGRVLDLGCGAGRDTRFLLAHGWSVTAVDCEAEAVALLAQLPGEHLRVMQSSFEDFDYGYEVYDQFALPFNLLPIFLICSYPFSHPLLTEFLHPFRLLARVS
jgi:SAM-dependent methyltransferase